MGWVVAALLFGLFAGWFTSALAHVIRDERAAKTSGRHVGTVHGVGRQFVILPGATCGTVFGGGLICGLDDGHAGRHTAYSCTEVSP
jgi:hypothetical protein